MKPNPKRIYELLHEIADERYHWTYLEDGSPMWKDAQVFLDEITRIKLAIKDLPIDFNLKI